MDNFSRPRGISTLSLRYIMIYILYVNSYALGSNFAHNCSSTSTCVVTTNVVSAELVIFTVATEATDGYYRFQRSANIHQLNIKVLGFGEQWRGGDISKYPGAGQKVRLLREGMKRLKYNNSTVVMFVDSYDVIFAGGTDEILKAFKKFHADIVFSTESSCWPDPSLANLFPEVKANEKRFLNSGGFIGYASHIDAMLSVNSQVSDDDDDQLFYSRIFLNKELTNHLKIRLDTRSVLFQSLNGALHEVSIKFRSRTGFLYNTLTGNTPLIIHGNGPIKTEFNSLSNYLCAQWTPLLGCTACKENTISLASIKLKSMPRVFIAVFIEHPTPFIDDFFTRFSALNYPKNRIDVFIHYRDSIHAQSVEDFISTHSAKYNSVRLYDHTSELNDWSARNLAIEVFSGRGCQYFFSIDGEVHLENVNTLNHLIETNRSVIAPLLSRPGKQWSNFWGALDDNGFYQRSTDYYDILVGELRGIWNVPYITGAYLVHSYRVSLLRGLYVHGDLDADMAFCKNLRQRGVFLYVDNQHYYGHLVNSENFETNHLHNDLYSIMDNQYTWENKYIHPDFKRSLHEQPLDSFDQPCPDVYWIPFVSPVFCKHLIEETENYGQWSNGKNEDSRIVGGYENVPTVDIHTHQIGWEPQWLHILKEYVRPISSKVYQGYYSPVRAVMNFIVRYRLADQYLLHPHNDASTFTINIALNTPGLDYQGGGTRFIRYNCSVTQSRLGWMLMHPGRLTHYHEGLPITDGVRYIMVSFIDP